MQIISDDLGTYSVKFLKFRVERNRIVYDSAREIVIDTDEINIQEENPEQALQLDIIKHYLDEVEGEYRLIFHAPNEMLTTRFLNLPVNNRKKAQMMIPFQLEEDIPYGLAQSHLAYAIQTHKDHSTALVDIVPRESFQPFFNRVESSQIYPKAITSQDSVYQHFIKQNKDTMPQAFCVLDLGHTSTKAYFYFENELVAVHKSYIAGKTLNEIISENYKIDLEEASLYKHQNCFFLTQDQYPQVNDNQKTFATLMEKAMTPLAHEFKRWEIGFRVLHGVGISEVLLTGGTSNIKNANNFFAEQFEVPTNFLESFENDVNADKIDGDEKFRRKFSYADLQSKAYRDKSSIVNFLNGDFSLQGQSDLPLQSFAFIASRAAFLTLLAVLSLGLERIVIHNDLSTIDKSLISISKNPTLELTARQRRLLAKRPEMVQRELKRRDEAIEQEISVLQASANTNAMSSLKTLATLTSGLDIELIQYQALSGDEFSAVFKAKSTQVLEQLEETLSMSGIKNVFTDKNESKLTLAVTGTEQ
ncbi:MAG: pilus assembly protein PilM [Bacteriovoracaceae bacterium]|nr:pilus assembly protein PilM [Bacteriovoracaceae bacterium]